MDIKRVRRLGKSYAHPLIVLVATSNVNHDLRIGISTSRSIGNAVKRNRSKRLIRAVVQDLIDRISPGQDILLIAREPIVEATFQETKMALLNVLDRARILKVVNGS
jgi:ribonuclease P protein component